MTKLCHFGVIGFVFASFLFGSSQPRAADVGGMSEPMRLEGIHWPGEGGKRIKVALGVYLVDFARINLREESFDMAGYLDVRWTDPSIALKADERKGRVRRFRPSQAWTPALEFINSVEQAVADERAGDLYVDDDGQVSQRVRFNHKFQTVLKVNRFPFDSQRLAVVIAPFDPFADDLDFDLDRTRVGKLSQAALTEWDIGAVDARIEANPEGDVGDERFVFDVTIQRRSTFYLWRVLLPMTLLVMTSWTVFWFEPTNLQPQISTGLAILLSLVTFTYAIDFSLPKVAYLTFIDRYTLTSFAFVLAVIFSVSAIHLVVNRHGVDRALKFQKWTRSAFPIVFFASVAVVAFVSFR